VATHICDSLKRKLKSEGNDSLQGEFGIGLLGFWAIGQNMTISSLDDNGNVWDMTMSKGDAGYHVQQRPVLMTTQGTEIIIQPIQTSSSVFSGEKICSFLADELSERIKTTGVEIIVKDVAGKFEQVVKPKDYSGEFIDLPDYLKDILDPHLDLDIYFKSFPKNRKVALFKHGTRVIDNVCSIEALNHSPWDSGYFTGKIDYGFINLSPATRLGVVDDDHLKTLIKKLRPLEDYLKDFIFEHEISARKKSTDASRRSIKSALKEALLALHKEGFQFRKKSHPLSLEQISKEKTYQDDFFEPTVTPEENGQKLFFEIAGSLHSAFVSPTSTALQINSVMEFQAIGRDKQRRVIDDISEIDWKVIEGTLALRSTTHNTAQFQAPDKPGIARIRATLTHRGVIKYAEALVTISTQATNPMESESDDEELDLEIPDMELVEKHGELWRSSYDQDKFMMYVNSGHRDYIFASRNNQMLTRYIAKLYCKELVLINSHHKSAVEIMDQFVQIETYLDEYLKSRS